MPDYEDDIVVLDDDYLLIKSYRWPGDKKSIPYRQIEDVEVFEVGFWTGRHQLVGLPLGRPHNWFSWNRSRKGRQTAVGLDLGRWVRPTIVPEDAAMVADILRKRSNQIGTS